METIYIQKLNWIFFIGVLAVAWCCVSWVGNRKRQLALFIVAVSEIRVLLVKQFPHEVHARMEKDVFGELLAMSVRPLPYEKIIPQIVLYGFTYLFVIWVVYDLYRQKVKLKHNAQQIWASWRAYRPLFSPKSK